MKLKNLRDDSIFKLIKNSISISKIFIENYVKDGFTTIDATIGNGNDTLLLGNSVGESGKVYGFDIQEKAIESTFLKLKTNGILNRVKLIKDSHSNLENYIDEKVDFIIYNLGYLPGSDKSIITRKESTIESIKSGLKILKPNGCIMITSYIGHEGGLEENMAIKNLLNSLDQRKFNVIETKFINQKKNPPILYIIEKSKGE